MKLAFVLIAGSLATAAAVLLLLPLVRRRADSLPAAGAASLVVTFVFLLGAASLYAGFTKFDWAQESPVTDTPAAKAAALAQELARNPDDPQRWMQLGGMYM